MSVSSFVPIFCEVKRNNPSTVAVVLPAKAVNPFSNAPPNPLLTTLKIAFPAAKFVIDSAPDLKISLTK